MQCGSCNKTDLMLHVPHSIFWCVVRSDGLDFLRVRTRGRPEVEGRYWGWSLGSVLFCSAYWSKSSGAPYNAVLIVMHYKLILQWISLKIMGAPYSAENTVCVFVMLVRCRFFVSWHISCLLQGGLLDIVYRGDQFAIKACALEDGSVALVSVMLQSGFLRTFLIHLKEMRIKMNV